MNSSVTDSAPRTNSKKRRLDPEDAQLALQRLQSVFKRQEIVNLLAEKQNDEKDQSDLMAALTHSHHAAEIRDLIKESKIKEGIVTVYCPHTTSALCINDNGDPDVITDMIYALDKAFPDDPNFKHMEGNSSAHLKSINLGSTMSLPLNDGLIEMGIWQGVFFCEFDGPRDRKVLIHITGE